MTAAGAERLSARTLQRARIGALPEYDRTVAPVITHVGFGAFARAHVAVYADELLRQGRPAMISGVSLRNHRAQDQLEPQDGLFTVAVREPDAATSLRVVGALATMRTGAAAALEAMAAPATKLVTLTITEKGYDDTDDGAAHSGGPTSAPALIVQALAHRRRAGLAPPTVASLDNLLDNGTVLRSRVLEAADRMEPSLAPWIAADVRFPSSVVDRMVPASTEQDLTAIADDLGLIDRAAVHTERHRSWIMESVDGLAALADVGVDLVEDVAPFERRKLWLLNGPHSAAAYGGLLAGQSTIAAAVTDPLVARFVRDIVDQTLQVAELPASARPGAFAAEALHRFSNPTLGHTCAQVGADGSSKLPQRLLPIVAARRERCLDTRAFALVAAIWIAATAGVTVRGDRLPRLEDPVADELRTTAARNHDLHRLTRVALEGRSDPSFVLEVASMLTRLTTEGQSLLGAER